MVKEFNIYFSSIARNLNGGGGCHCPFCPFLLFFEIRTGFWDKTDEADKTDTNGHKTDASHGHNLAIFHQILTNEHTKMTSSLRRIEWNKILSSISLFYILVFWPHFCSEASHGQCCTYGLKTTLKLLVHVLAIMASSYLKIVFLQKSGLNPPPPPPP